MAKKVQKKPAKKTETKKAVKAKKVTAKPKAAAAPKKKTTAAKKKAAAPAKRKAAPKKRTAAPAKRAAAPKKITTSKPAKTTPSFSIVEFADMTYLTEKGVRQWLQQGLLKGQQDAQGNWRIDASNLEVPNVKRLVR